MSLLKQIGSAERIEPESVKKIFEVPSGKMRGILMMSREQMKESYSKIDGYIDFVDSLSDAQIMGLADNDTFFRIVGTKFDLNAVQESYKMGRSICVLLDVDDTVVEKATAKDIQTVGDARGFLRTLLNHKFYAGALNAEAIVNENATREKFSPSKLMESFSIVSTEKIKTIEAPVSVPAVEPINIQLAEKISSILPAETASKKKWVFTVNRSQAGLIESIEVTEH